MFFLFHIKLLWDTKTSEQYGHFKEYVDSLSFCLNDQNVHESCLFLLKAPWIFTVIVSNSNICTHRFHVFLFYLCYLTCHAFKKVHKKQCAELYPCPKCWKQIILKKIFQKLLTHSSLSWLNCIKLHSASLNPVEIRKNNFKSSSW